MNSQNNNVAKVACPVCAHDNRAGARFCAACGFSIDRHCWQCAAPVSTTAKFCDACGADLDKATRPTASGSSPLEGVFEKPERRQMTVMFCDLVGSTRLSRQIDPEDLRIILRTYQDACADIIARYDGHISRYVGDGIFILFGYPHAHDNDAERAARAALDLLERIPSLRPDTSCAPVKLSIRIGIATGLVVAGDVIGERASQEEAIIGETPNLAAGLQGLAEADSVFVSLSTYRLIRHFITCRSLGPRELKGYPEPVPVYEVISPTAAPEVSTESKAQRLVPMIGRDRDMAFLRDLWVQAKEGAGHVVLVQGEPGIGKSRLVEEFKRACESESVNALICRCSPYFTNSALYSVINLLRRVLKISGNDSPETALAKLEAAVGPNIELPTSAHDLAFSLSLSQSTPNGANVVTLQPQRAQPFEAIIAFLLGLSESKPLIFIVEDLHWVDPSTLQLLALLVDQVAMARILVLTTARPEFRAEWLTHGHTSQLTLGRLMPTEAKTLVSALTTDTPLPESVHRALVAKTDGVPLFIEELTRTVIDLGASADAEAAESVLSKDGSVVIPETLRDSLMARLDRLQDAKPLAQLAAVIGRTFSYKLLKAAVQFDESDLKRRLERLVKAELVYQRGMPPGAIYHFKHSLIQDTAYDSLLTSKRREFHGRIASALENQFPEVGRLQPELMARHHTLSGQTAEAVAYWNLASERALQQSANLEARHHAKQGLHYVKELPEGRHRDELSLSLYIHLSTAISGTKGDAVPELEDIYQKAATILNRLEDASLAFSLTREMHAFYLVRGPLMRAVELGHRMLKLAENSSDPQKRTDSRRCLGWAYICHGKLEKGQTLIRKALSLYDVGDSREHTRHNTIDPGGVGMINLAWSEWLAGKSDTAARLTHDAVALSRTIDHPYTLAYSLCMGAAVFQCRREPEAVLSLVDEAISVAKKRGYRYWNAWGTCLQGWANAQLGRPESGIQALEAGLNIYRATGATLFVPHIHCMTAESQYSVGNFAEARRHLQMAEDIESNNQIYFYSAETQRLFAMVEKELGETESSVTHFKKAWDLAKTQKAKSFELRVALSIVQNPFSNMIMPDAKETLAAILNNIHEGQDDMDQKIARGLATSERF